MRRRNVEYDRATTESISRASISQKGDFGLKSLCTLIAEKNSSKSAMIGIAVTHHPLKTA